MAACMVLASAPVWADTCRIYQHTETRSSVSIRERSEIRRAAMTDPSGDRRCRVDFMVRIGPDWHAAQYEHRFRADLSWNEGCAVAVHEAERAVTESVARRQVQEVSRLVCDDDPDRRQVQAANPGTVLQRHQMRPHPDFPADFRHNGTVCRWFLEPGWTGEDIRPWNGVACRIDQDRWVVVDRF